MSNGGIIILALAAFTVYFLPWIVGACRDVKGGGGIVLINIFLGWTLVGWLVAFVWACTARTWGDERREQKRHDELLAALKSQENKSLG